MVVLGTRQKGRGHIFLSVVIDNLLLYIILCKHQSVGFDIACCSSILLASIHRSISLHVYLALLILDTMYSYVSRV